MLSVFFSWFSWWHGKRWSSSKQRFVTSRWVFFVQRWAMVRSKATDEYIPNLTPKKFFCMWITRKSEGEWRHRAMWEVRIHHKRVFWDIESFVARTETSNGALESWWWVHSKSNLNKKILAFGSPESRVKVTSPAMWEVHLHQERTYCDIEHLLLVQRRAMVRWKAGNE